MALVRVRLNGVEKNVSEALAETAGLKVLDEPVLRPDGRLRPDERVRQPAKKAAAKKTTGAKKAAADEAAEPAGTAEEAS